MKKLAILLAAGILLSLANPAAAKHLHPEKWYQERWAVGQALLYATRTGKQPGIR